MRKTYHLQIVTFGLQRGRSIQMGYKRTFAVRSSLALRQGVRLPKGLTPDAYSAVPQPLT